MSEREWHAKRCCPTCGRFTSGIVGFINDYGLQRVEGECSTHGTVDLTKRAWSYDDFLRTTHGGPGESAATWMEAT